MTMRKNNGTHATDVGKTADAERAIERLLKLAGPRPDVPGERAVRVRAAVQERWQDCVTEHKAAEKKARLARWRVPAMGLAAAVVLTVAAVLGVQTLRAPIDVATVQQIAGTVSLDTNGGLHGGRVLVAGSLLRTGTDGGARLALASGHTLFVDRGSMLELVGPERLELIAGAVYLESQDGGSGSVTVRTPYGRASDIGTRFEVRLLDQSMRVRVRDGSVELGEDRFFGADVRVAAAGEELLLDEAGRFERTAMDDEADHWAWFSSLREPFELEGSTLAGFLDWITQDNDWQLRYTGGDVQRFARQNVLHGELDDLEGEAALDAILSTVGLDWRLDEGVLTIGPLQRQRVRR
jgi:ferric-dicitrate binding protein FerR (iron transport regulator)